MAHAFNIIFDVKYKHLQETAIKPGTNDFKTCIILNLEDNFYISPVLQTTSTILPIPYITMNVPGRQLIYEQTHMHSHSQSHTTDEYFINHFNNGCTILC